MDLKTACHNILDQMSYVIEQLDDNEFVKPSNTLNGSTLGQHFRHAIEFFECLEKGYNSARVSYDNRDHDKNIESSRVLAMEVISRVKDFISTCSTDKKLTLEVSYHPESNESICLDTHLARELVYNIEHVVHHMALVKIGLRESKSSIDLPAAFGVAVSTIKYHGTQA